MRADRIGRTEIVRRLRPRAEWLLLFAGFFFLMLALRSGEREGFAQSTTTPATNQAQTNTQTGAPGAGETAAGQQVKSEEPAKPDNRDAVSDARKSPIAEQSANLLKLANSLKAEVDKTTADTLSVPVIREADEIEKLARKMRSK